MKIESRPFWYGMPPIPYGPYDTLYDLISEIQHHDMMSVSFLDTGTRFFPLYAVTTKKGYDMDDNDVEDLEHAVKEHIAKEQAPFTVELSKDGGHVVFRYVSLRKVGKDRGGLLGI
jgi:hypothetical protein